MVRRAAACWADEPGAVPLGRRPLARVLALGAPWASPGAGLVPQQAGATQTSRVQCPAAGGGDGRGGAQGDRRPKRSSLQLRFGRRGREIRLPPSPRPCRELRCLLCLTCLKRVDKARKTLKGAPRSQANSGASTGGHLILHHSHVPHRRRHTATIAVSATELSNFKDTSYRRR